MTILEEAPSHVGSPVDYEHTIVEVEGPKKTISFWGLGVLGFFITCAGPFGVEPCVKAGGPLLTLIGLLAVPFVFAGPQGLMTAELSTMEGLSANGGYILWVQSGLGDVAGFVNGYACIATNLVDIAVYIALACDSLDRYLESTEGHAAPSWMRWTIQIATLLIVMFANIRGVEVVEWISILLLFAVLSPFVVMFCIVAARGDLDASSWGQLPKRCSLDGIESYDECIAEGGSLETHVDFGIFISTLLWSFMGWDSLGCVAGEIKNPRKTYTLGIALTIVLDVVTYFVPIVIAVSLSRDFGLFDDGYFIESGTLVSEWMGVWVLVAAVLSSVGQYNSCMTTTSRACWSCGGGDGEIVRDSILPRVFGHTFERYGTPAVAVVFQTATTALLMNFEFSLLVHLNVFLNNITLVLESLAFCAFRWYEPERKRLFRVPLGWWGVAMVFAPKMLLIGFSFAVAPWVVWVVGGSFTLLAVVGFYVRRWFRARYRAGAPTPQNAKPAVGKSGTASSSGPALLDPDRGGPASDSQPLIAGK